MSEPQSTELAPTGLVGGRITKKAPQERTAPPEPQEVDDPEKVPPGVPLVITNSGEVDVQHLMGGPVQIAMIHSQLVKETAAWAAEHGRELSNIAISWEVKLQAIATTPTLVMPDQP